MGAAIVGGIVTGVVAGAVAGSVAGAAAWGLSLTGRLYLLEHDRWVFSGAYGQGLGRYLLGIQSTAGSTIDSTRTEVALRDNWGLLTAYQHQWSAALRSSAMVGYAKSEPSVGSRAGHSSLPSTARSTSCGRSSPT